MSCLKADESAHLGQEWAQPYKSTHTTVATYVNSVNFRTRTMLCLAQNHNSQVNCTLRHPAMKILELLLPLRYKSLHLQFQRACCHFLAQTGQNPQPSGALFVYIHTKAALPGETGRDAFTILCQCTFGGFHISPISKNCKTESKRNKILQVCGALLASFLLSWTSIPLDI